MGVFDKVLHFICLPLVALSFLITPLTNDSRIYLGVEHIAATYFPFPQGIDLAWEIKPISNRLINYLFYKVGTFFVSFDNHFWFGVSVKLTALILIVAVAWYFSRVIRVPLTFATVFITLTTMANFCTLQAEYWGVVFALLCIALIYKETRLSLFAAGLILPFMALFKGVTSLLVITVFCAVFLLKEKPFEGIRQYLTLYRPVAAGMFFSLAFLIAAQLTIWPHMVSDAIMSPYLAHAANLGAFVWILGFVMQFIVLPFYLPAFAIGVVIGFYYLARIKYLNNAHITTAYAAMWVTPAIMVFLQGEFFVYQFIGFAVPVVVTLVLAERCVS